MDEVERDILRISEIAGARQRARRQGTGGQGHRTIENYFSRKGV